MEIYLKNISRRTVLSDCREASAAIFASFEAPLPPGSRIISKHAGAPHRACFESLFPTTYGQNIDNKTLSSASRVDRTVFALTMFCLFAFEGKVRCHKQTVYFGRCRRHRSQETLVAMADFGSDAVDLIDGFVFTEQNFERQNGG